MEPVRKIKKSCVFWNVILWLIAITALILSIFAFIKPSSTVDKETSNSSIVPTGSVFSYTGTTVPEGYLLCDGSTYNKNDYLDLYNAVKNTFGGDSNNFKVPNLINSFVKGGSSTTGEKKGQDDVVLKQENIPMISPSVSSDNDTKIPVVFNSSSGISDWKYIKGKPSGDGTENMWIPYTLNESSNGKNLSSAFTIGEPSPVPIDNTPPHFTMKYIIKT